MHDFFLLVLSYKFVSFCVSYKNNIPDFSDFGSNSAFKEFITLKSPLHKLLITNCFAQPKNVCHCSYRTFLSEMASLGGFGFICLSEGNFRQALYSDIFLSCFKMSYLISKAVRRIIADCISFSLGKLHLRLQVEHFCANYWIYYTE